jgi:hypothetical protein
VAHTPCSPRPFGPGGPSRARALSSLPLSVLAGPPVSVAAFPARAPAPSLSLLTGPLCQLPRPCVTALPSCACRGLRAHVARRARNRPALDHLSPAHPLPPSFAHLQNPFSTSPTLRARQRGAAVARRRPEPVSRRRRSPTVPSATVSFASTSATRDTLQFLLSLPDFLCPRSPAVLRTAAVVRHR